MRNAKVFLVAGGCPRKIKNIKFRQYLLKLFKGNGRMDGRTEGNPISPFRNKVARGGGQLTGSKQNSKRNTFCLN